MGRTIDFAKRRIAGWIVFWTILLVFVYVLYQGNQPTQSAWLVILGLAALVSFMYTRHMKRKQREARSKPVR